MRCAVSRLGLGSGLGQTFPNCACAITKLRTAFCKLRRLTNRAQLIHRTAWAWAATVLDIGAFKSLCYLAVILSTISRHGHYQHNHLLTYCRLSAGPVFSSSSVPVVFPHRRRLSCSFHFTISSFMYSFPSVAISRTFLDYLLVLFCFLSSSVINLSSSSFFAIFLTSTVVLVLFSSLLSWFSPSILWWSNFLHLIISVIRLIIFHLHGVSNISAFWKTQPSSATDSRRKPSAYSDSFEL